MRYDRRKDLTEWQILHQAQLTDNRKPLWITTSNWSQSPRKSYPTSSWCSCASTWRQPIFSVSSYLFSLGWPIVWMIPPGLVVSSVACSSPPLSPHLDTREQTLSNHTENTRFEKQHKHLFTDTICIPHLQLRCLLGLQTFAWPSQHWWHLSKPAADQWKGLRVGGNHTSSANPKMGVNDLFNGVFFFHFYPAVLYLYYI